MTELSAEYRRKIRKFMQEKGRKVMFDPNHEGEVSVYGWVDDEACQHVRSREGRYPGDGCFWVVQPGTVLTEETYDEFTDTFSDNKREIGINVAGCWCACGKYTDVTLRYEGSLADVLKYILNIPVRQELIL